MKSQYYAVWCVDSIRFTSKKVASLDAAADNVANASERGMWKNGKVPAHANTRLKPMGNTLPKVDPNSLALDPKGWIDGNGDRTDVRTMKLLLKRVVQ